MNLSLIRIFAFVLFITSASCLHGQYYYLPISNDLQWSLERIVLDTGNYVHHGIRPYSRSEIFAIDSTWTFGGTEIKEVEKGSKPHKKWVNRKLFNESLIILDGEDYRIEINPLLNLELGFSNPTEKNYNFLSTRGLWIEGKLGNEFSFYTMVAENMGRFPQYYHKEFTSTNVVLGWGQLNQTLPSRSLDFPMVMGGICYKPSKYFTFSLSQGKQFFGEGYRSMILSDYAMPNANFKIEIDFGKKVKYISLYSLYLDPRSIAAVNGYSLKKYTSFHYLSWNINSRLNLSFFESMIWVGDSANPNQGFDFHFLNPIIMYRQVEKVIGGKGGNAMIGFGSSYLLKRHLKLYAQLAIDDFSLDALRQLSKGHWLNFYSGQVGLKYAEAFGIENLFFQLEYNVARPFMYAHRSSISNYTHNLLPLAHPWGSSFQELLTRANYQIGRWLFRQSVSFGERAEDPIGRNLGNNLFESIFDRNEIDLGYFIAKGENYNIMVGETAINYVLNRATGARLGFGLRYRFVTPRSKMIETKKDSWVFINLTTPFFNSYYDY